MDDCCFDSLMFNIRFQLVCKTIKTISHFGETGERKENSKEKHIAVSHFGSLHNGNQNLCIDGSAATNTEFVCPLLTFMRLHRSQLLQQEADMVIGEGYLPSSSINLGVRKVIKV